MEIRETVNGQTTAYVAVNPFPAYLSTSLAATDYTQGTWGLSRYAPKDLDPQYGYVLTPNDGSDAILYTPCDAFEDAK